MKSFQQLFKAVTKDRNYELLDQYYENTHKRISEGAVLSITQQLGKFFLGSCRLNRRNEAERLMELYNHLDEADLPVILFSLQVVYFLLQLSKGNRKEKQIVNENQFKQGFNVFYSSDIFESNLKKCFSEKSNIFGVEIDGSDLLSIPKLRELNLFEEDLDCRLTTVQDLSNIDSAYNSDSNMWENISILDPLKYRYISWEKQETEKSPSKSQLVTDSPCSTFQQIYYEYNLPCSIDIIYVPEKKLLMMCGGIQSDLFIFNQGFYCKYSSITTDGTTAKSTNAFIQKYLQFGSNMVWISTYINDLRHHKKSNLTISAFAEGVQILKELIQTNLIHIEYNILHLMNLDLLLRPLEKLVAYFRNLFQSMEISAQNQNSSSIYLCKLYLEISKSEKLQGEAKQLSILKYLFDKASSPLFRWISNWLNIGLQVGMENFDPVTEFFISKAEDDQYFISNSYNIPDFLSQKFVDQIFAVGNTWRVLQPSTVDKTIALPVARWEMNEAKIEIYQQEIAKYKFQFINSLQKRFIALKMQQVNETEEKYASRIRELVLKRENLKNIQEAIGKQKENMQQKKSELKYSIEQFVKEQEKFKRLNLEMENRRNLWHQEETSKKVAQERLLESKVMKKMMLQYENDLKILDKKSELLDWRTRRIQLNTFRNPLIAQRWDKGSLYSFDEPAQLFDYCMVNSKDENFPNQLAESATNSSYKVISENTEIEKISGIGKDEVGAGEPEISKVYPTSILHSVSNQSNSDAQNSNLVNVELEGDERKKSTSEGPFDLVINSAQHTSFAKDKQFINWIISPQASPAQLQVIRMNTNDWINSEFQKIINISKELSNLPTTIQESIDRSVVHQWKTQLDLLSRFSIAELFTVDREIDQSDLRFYLSVLKCIYLMGDGEYIRLIVDRLFKDSPSSLNLNGQLSKIPSNQLEYIFQDIIATTTKHLGNGMDDLFEIQIKPSATGLELAGCLRIGFNAPKPFNIFIDPFLKEYSNIFSSILPILQAQEAFNRINRTLNWKNDKTLFSEDKVRIIQFMSKCHAFLSSLLFYVFEHAINKPWEQFIKKVDEYAALELHSAYFTLDGILESHSNILQDIQRNLFLHSQQFHIAQALKDICSTIIEFSKKMQNIQTEKSLAQLDLQFYADFKNLEKFLGNWIDQSTEVSSAGLFLELVQLQIV
ncbi:hypothetical protein HDV01_007563 [Terramyces sp. JEL0728]|nr:hypothetical protein HDV01_007563 [Terramyces sp. JEL0728]